MGNRRRVGLIVDREQLCAAAGVSDSAITAWEKRGMPVVRKGRGRGIKSLYDLDEVRAWCNETGYGQTTQALLARFSRGEPPSLPAPPPSPPPASPVQTSALVAQELGAAAAAVPVPDPAAAESDPHGYLAARAKREMFLARLSELDYLEKTRALVPSDALERFVTRALRAFRDKILLVAHMVQSHHPDTPHEVIKTIERLHHEALTGLADSLSRGDFDQPEEVQNDGC